MAEPLDPSSFYGAMADGYAERARVNATRAVPLYHWSRREVLYNTFRQRERFVDALRAWGRLDLSGLEILDVGCGSASFLRWLLELGATASRLHGVEAMDAHAEESRRRSPGLDIRRVDGLTLPFADASLDLVTANVVFSSIVDRRYREATAREITRVLKVGGAMFLFDLRWVKPGSKHVVPITDREVDRLFPGFHRKSTSLFLPPPLARRLSPSFPTLAIVLERCFPWTNSHRYHSLEKR